MITTLINSSFKTDNGKRYSERKIGGWIAGGIALCILWQMSQLRAEIHSIDWPKLDQLQAGDRIKLKLFYKIENPSLIGCPSRIQIKCKPLSHDAAAFGKTLTQSRWVWLRGGHYPTEFNFEMKVPRFTGTYSLIEGFNRRHIPLRTIWLFGSLIKA